MADEFEKNIIAIKIELAKQGIVNVPEELVHQGAALVGKDLSKMSDDELNSITGGSAFGDFLKNNWQALASGAFLGALLIAGGIGWYLDWRDKQKDPARANSGNPLDGSFTLSTQRYNDVD